MQNRKPYLILLYLLFPYILWAQTAQQDDTADSLVQLMTMEEQLTLLGGYHNFFLHPVERLGIPPVGLTDGPMGINGHGRATAFPATIALAATWNRTLAHAQGLAIAREGKSKGLGILLAPGVNMYRIPHNGRNFEYLGEDPFLASEIVVPYIQGVHDGGMMAVIKHFVANNQDYDRHRVSSNIDERTLHEIYFPAFRAAVQKAGVMGIMTSYNPLNGVHTSENSWLMQDILRKLWGFRGMVISDWISVYSTQAINAGLDLEMPRAMFMNRDSILPLIRAGIIKKETIHQKATNIVRCCLHFNLYDTLPKGAINQDQHKKLCRDIAAEGIVLLKNQDATLPIIPAKYHKIAIVGPTAHNTPYSGGGAARISLPQLPSIVESIKNRTDEKFQVTHFKSDSTGLSPVQINKLHQYDIVIVCAGFNQLSEGEAHDRPFSLPAGQNHLIKQCHAANKNTLVVIIAGGSIAMPWADEIPAILHCWYPGEAGTDALADILFGYTNPSGKLPITIEKRWRDNAAYSSYDTSFATPHATPLYSIDGKKHTITPMPYTEGIFTGYRHYDHHHIEPRFCFGHGLSYTQFSITSLQLSNSTITTHDTLYATAVIKNRGSMAGQETVQLYIHDVQSTLIRPERELKGFEKIMLQPGEQRTVTFTITEQHLHYYQPREHQWITEPGKFVVSVGSSSRDISASKSFTLKK